MPIPVDHGTDTVIPAMTVDVSDVPIGAVPPNVGLGTDKAGRAMATNVLTMGARLMGEVGVIPTATSPIQPAVGEDRIDLLGVGMAADPGRQTTTHEACGSRVEILSAGDMAKLVFHDAQQVDAIHGRRVDGLQINSLRRGREDQPSRAADGRRL